MKSIYRAMQVTRPGTLELVERQTPTPGSGEVLIKVEACGLCGADISDIEGADPAPQPPCARPRSRGTHRGTRRPYALNLEVEPARRRGASRRPLQRVCPVPPGPIPALPESAGGRRHPRGGYAEMMLARSTGLVSIPDELDSRDAAPILCAGIATLTHSGSAARNPAIP